MSETTSGFSFHYRVNLSSCRAAIEQIRAELAKFIVGQQDMIDLMIAAMLANGHILIEGVPGVAKTLSAKLLARTLNIEFSRIQFTPDLMPSDVLGTSVFNPQNREFEFRKGPIFSQLTLIDEINRAPAKTQAALFEVMEERQITLDGITYALEPPFLVVATQNPIEQEGTYRLPEAQLDRFLFKIEVNYPSFDEEVQILKSIHERKTLNDFSSVNPVLTGKEIQQLQEIVRSIHVDANLLSYIAKLVTQSRDHKDLYLGASPRASISILGASKAIAVTRGRDFVIPEDIQFVALPVLRHRLILTPEKEMEGSVPEDIIKQIIAQTEVPR